MFFRSAAGGDWANLQREEGLLPHGHSTVKVSVHSSRQAWCGFQEVW
jgi:hypothetical protein